MQYLAETIDSMDESIQEEFPLHDVVTYLLTSLEDLIMSEQTVSLKKPQTS